MGCHIAIYCSINVSFLDVLLNMRLFGVGVMIEVKSKEEGKAEELKPRQAGKNQINPPEYLLFLKLRKDGLYEPVSGQLDAALSVRTIFPSGVIKIP